MIICTLQTVMFILLPHFLWDLGFSSEIRGLEGTDDKVMQGSYIEGTWVC